VRLPRGRPLNAVCLGPAESNSLSGGPNEIQQESSRHRSKWVILAGANRQRAQLAEQSFRPAPSAAAEALQFSVQ